MRPAVLGLLLFALLASPGCGGGGEVRSEIPPGRLARTPETEEIEEWLDRQKPTGEGNYLLGNRAFWEGDFERAVVEYRMALKINPDLWRAWSNLGASQYQLRRLREAEASLRRAIRIQDWSSQTYYTLALVYDQLGQSEKALQSCRRAVERDPNDFEAIRLFKHLSAKSKQ